MFWPRIVPLSDERVKAPDAGRCSLVDNDGWEACIGSSLNSLYVPENELSLSPGSGGRRRTGFGFRGRPSVS